MKCIDKKNAKFEKKKTSYKKNVYVFVVVSDEYRAAGEQEQSEESSVLGADADNTLIDPKRVWKKKLND